MELLVFVLASAMVLAGAVGVVAYRNSQAVTHEVPDLVGATADEAAAAATEFGWLLSLDEIRRDGTTAGEVIETDPVAGTESAARQPTPSTPVMAAKRPTAPTAVPRPPPASGGFVWPVKGKVVSAFGAKSKGLHNDGINISAQRGTPVRAAENGVVAYAGNELRGFGNMLLIKHAGGWITAYAHNEKLLVARGDEVRRGQIVARVGSSGSVTRPQLHFELRKGKQAVDPLKYLGRGSA